MMDVAQAEGRIVVVDDDRLVREIVCDALKGLGRVEACESGERALESLSRERADLVISDLTMPGMSGIQLLERIQREHPGTEFVLLTANASVESAVGALRMGAADYLTKPIRPEELALVVEQILARRRLLAENARLRAEIEIIESCRVLLRCLDPGEVYAVALDLVLSTLGCRRGVVHFHRTAVPRTDGVATRGFDEDQARRLRDMLVTDKVPDLDSVSGPVIVTDGKMHDLLRSCDVEAGPAVVVPVRGQESEAGLIWAFDETKGRDSRALDRVRLVARHAELALQNAERFHRAKERAFIDDVTEAYNARYLLQATEHEIQRAERYKKDLAVLFLDLDRFKLVNDQYGHLVGSDVLRQLAEVLQECIRQVDTLARYGGDEFTILLLDSDLEEGVAVGERIRGTVADTIFEGERGAPIRLTISIGVATYPAHASDRDTLLDVADKAMYLAKSQGRDCVCTADQLQT